MILSYSFLIAAVFLTGTAHCDDKNEMSLIADDGVLTESDKESLLEMHNTQRSNTALGKTGTQPMATDMVKLVWDQDIADGAKAWADNCKWMHDFNYGKGENLYWAGSSGDNIDNIDRLLRGVQRWYNEHSYYDYDKNKCENGKACGHYIQNVRTQTKKVGCGYATDCNFSGTVRFEAFLVCRYDNSGNWGGQKPYTKANTSNEVTSACPSGYDPDSTSGLCILSSKPTVCKNSMSIMILTTEDGDSAPYMCNKKSNQVGFSCSETGKLASHCPVTCGKCLEYACSDSEASFVMWKKVRKCSWLKNLAPQKIEKHCSKSSVATTCRDTCNFCD